jgi:hypothetical protein
MKILTDATFNPFDWFPRWQKLSLETRRLFLEKIDSTLKIPIGFFSDEQLEELTGAGFKTPEKAALIQNIRPFRNLIRSMSRHRHFDPKTERLSIDYITDHLIAEECSSLASASGHPYGNPAYYARKLAEDSGWITKLLKADSPELWEAKHTGHGNQHLHPDSAAVLKSWVQHLEQGSNPIPPEKLPNLGNGRIASEAFRAGIRYLLLFPALDSKTLDPLIGLWPAVHTRLNRKKTPRPSPVPLPKGSEIYSNPLLLHDITTLLVSTTGDGLRLKAKGNLYQKEEEALAAQLMPPPPPGCGKSSSNCDRLDKAFCWALDMKLAARKGKPGTTYTLQATQPGKNWLAGSEAERLQSLADFMRLAHEKNLKNRWLEYGEISFLPYNPQRNFGQENQLNVETRVINAFTGCSADNWFSEDTFLKWNAETHNPLLVNHNNAIDRIFRIGTDSEPEREASWERVLHEFLHQRLVPLGGAKLAIDPDGMCWFAITPVGQYLMGKTDRFDHPFERPAGDLIVQPNFDVVFTAANPYAEGELTRYAQRIGHRVGTLFKITRESIHLAFNSGLDGELILESLGRISSKKLPRNVVAQIQDWGKSFRRVTVKNITVIDCGDSETAQHVRALFPKKTTLITATLLEIASEKNLTPLKKKLRQNGISIA